MRWWEKPSTVPVSRVESPVSVSRFTASNARLRARALASASASLAATNSSTASACSTDVTLIAADRAEPRGRLDGMRVGVAHHLGWAVAVTASDDHEVVDRRRIELVEAGVATAPIHHEGKALDDDAAAALVAQVRASAARATSAGLDELTAAVGRPIVSMSLRAWPSDFPEEIAVQRRAPYEARADSIMYRQVLAELARARGWEVHLYDAKDVEREAARILGGAADEVLRGPRSRMGPPWDKDHRMAFAATVVAS